MGNVRICFSWVCLILILAVALQDAVVCGVWRWNQHAIAKSYCVNKDRPAMACHGKCMLRTMLKDQHEERPGETKAPAPENRMQVTCSVAEMPLFADPQLMVRTNLISPVSEMFLPGYAPGVFHPPDVSVLT